MKKIMLLFALLLNTIVVSAQCTGTLLVQNLTNCDVVFQIYATDDNLGPCVAYFSDMQSLPSGTPATPISIPGGLSWSFGSPTTCTSPMTIPGYVVDYDASTNCNTATGHLVGDATTCGWTPTITLPSCACATSTIYVDWQNPAPGIWRLVVRY